jgi:hypothetical protein
MLDTAVIDLTSLIKDRVTEILREGVKQVIPELEGQLSEAVTENAVLKQQAGFWKASSDFWYKQAKELGWKADEQQRLLATTGLDAGKPLLASEFLTGQGSIGNGETDDDTARS